MDKLTDLLQTLATKLGVAVDILWAALLKQAVISGILTLVFVVLWVAFGFVIYRIHKNLTKDDAKAGYMEKYYDENVGVSAAMMIAFVIWAVVSLVGIPIAIENSITAFFNPEFWALKQILHGLK